jgi:hypothetical protein
VLKTAIYIELGAKMLPKSFLVELLELHPCSTKTALDIRREVRDRYHQSIGNHWTEKRIWHTPDVIDRLPTGELRPQQLAQPFRRQAS